MMVLVLALAGPGCQRSGAPAASQPAAPARDPEADQAAVAAALQRMVAAWNAHDMDAFGEVFTEDASFINVFGHRLLSRATIVEEHRKLHTGNFRETQLFPMSNQIRLVGEGVAVAVINWRLTNARDPRTDAPVETTSGFMTITLRAKGDDWRIVALQNGRTVPLPGGPQDAPAGQGQGQGK
jgi:uncharacterized protein (TIGR02246 family)